MTNTRRPATDLPYPLIRQIPGHRGGRALFELTEDFAFGMPLGAHGVFRWSAPAGRVTDFGSVPWFLWPLANPLSDHLSVSFLVHDDLCDDPTCPRVQADSMQRIIADHYGAGRWEQLKIYVALRLYAWARYGGRR